MTRHTDDVPIPDPHRSLDADLDLALRLAAAADAIGMRSFTGAAIDHETKADGSPVSDADREVERSLRVMVASERPDDGFLGEEVGASGSKERRWIVDGIDGTVLFVAGLTGWATNIALEVDGDVVLGVMTSAALGRRWWARRGRGAWQSRTAAPRATATRLRVSDRVALAGSRSTMIPPLDALTGPRRAAAELLVAAGRYVPPHEHGGLFVADGRADVCWQADGGPWDFAALAVIVEEAGGRFSNLDGRWDVHGRGPVVFSNGAIHAQVLDILAGAA